MEEPKIHETIALIAIATRGASVMLALPEEWKKDKHFVLQCIQYDPLSLFYASESLKDDEQVVFSAIEGDPLAMSMASKRLQNDKAFNLKCFKNIPMYTRHYASRYIKSITTRAMHDHGFLHYISALEFIIQKAEVDAEKKKLLAVMKRPVVSREVKPRRL